MSAERPVLILQMQRMGDLIMTFPLMDWLAREAPNRPIWVMAERIFYDDLLPLSPPVRYLQAESISMLMNERFGPVINLSHRDVAASVAGMVESEEVIGPVKQGGARYIRGAAQLYRASIVHNNRANRFHWADLNGLDCVAPDTMRSLSPAPPRSPHTDGRAPRIGLFVGASEAAKRPEAEFFGQLARHLADAGMAPVLLGGPGDTDIAERAAAVAGIDSLAGIDLAGRFSLSELVEFSRTLSLMITPDTGPMHLASFAGVPTLDLSMGPVAPWDTGPYPVGHYVLQSSLSCANCWRCTRPGQPCRTDFDPGHVAQLARAIVQGQELPHGKGVRLYRSGRDGDGLYELAAADGSSQPGARAAVARLWRAFFGCRFGVWDTSRSAAAWKDVAALPGMETAFAHALATLGAELAKALKSPGTALPEEFWSAHPAFLRPFTGYAHLFLQNGNYSSEAFGQVLSMVEELAAVAAS